MKTYLKFIASLIIFITAISATAETTTPLIFSVVSNVSHESHKFEILSSGTHKVKIQDMLSGAVGPLISKSVEIQIEDDFVIFKFLESNRAINEIKSPLLKKIDKNGQISEISFMIQRNPVTGEQGTQSGKDIFRISKAGDFIVIRVDAYREVHYLYFFKNKRFETIEANFEILIK